MVANDLRLPFSQDVFESCHATGMIPAVWISVIPCNRSELVRLVVK